MKPLTTAGAHLSPRQGSWTAGTVIAGLLVTLVSCLWLTETAREKDAARLREEAVLQKEALETRIELFVLMLRRLADRVKTERELTRNGWDELVEGTNPSGEYPGLASLGFMRLEEVKPMPAANGASWKLLGLEPPPSGLGPGNSRIGEHFHTLVEPLPKGPQTTTNRAGTESETFWARAKWAIEVAPASMPAQEILDAWQGVPDRGFRVLVPVHRAGRHAKALLIERHALACRTNSSMISLGHLEVQNDWGNARGLIYGDFAMTRFVASTFGTNARSVNFTIWDVSGNWRNNFEEPFNLVYGAPPRDRPYLEIRLEMKHYGRRLLMDFHTTPQFDAHSLRHWPKYAAFFGITITLLAAGLVFTRERALHREQAQSNNLRATNAELAGALRAREHLNRELHDTVIQSIYAAGLGLQNARRILGKDTDRASERLTEVMADLNGVIARLRGYIHGAKGASSASLAELMEAELSPFRRQGSTRLDIHIHDSSGLAPDDDVIPQVISIAREAVSNSVRHAAAGTISVTVMRTTSNVTVDVEDDGRGFNLSERAHSGCGLQNIRARAHDLNGIVHLHSAPGRGTRVRVIIPLLQPTPSPIPS